MRVVVPFDAIDPKSRLGSRLDPDERDAFARQMLRDVLDAIRAAGGEPLVLATAPLAAFDVPVVVDEQPLTDAVNDVLVDAFDPDTALDWDGSAPDESDSDSVEELAVVMADLALATPDALTDLFTTDGEVVLVPGRGGGTNAFVTRTAAFRVDYHGGSIRDHRDIAASCAGSVAELDSYRLSTDVDDPADLVEVLLHGRGGGATWLREAGFALSVTEGRVGIERDRGEP